ncbi:MAG: phosphotransferase family protein [Pseudomonadota bacterium]
MADFAEDLSGPLGADITNLHRLTAGASMESWAFESNGKSYILRRAPSGLETNTGIGGIPLATEAAIIQIAKDNGVTAPDVLHVFDSESAVGAGYVMTRLPGEALPPRLFKQPDMAPVLDELPQRLAQEMAAIHAIPVDTLPDTVPTAGEAELIDNYYAAYETINSQRPIYDLAFHWLRTHCPDAYDPPVLVHGDFRMGNLLIDESGLTAVLDWEIAHLGDPHQDLAYICAPSWRFGRRNKPVGGIGDIEPFLAAYEAASGRTIDRQRFQFWRVLTTLFWGSACMTMLGDWRTGKERTIERAAIGRRISEVEVDLLLLLAEIEGVEAPPLDPINIPLQNLQTGQTSLAEMITALSEWNDTEVTPSAKGRDRFQSRIAANLFAQLAREAQMGRDFAFRQRDRLKALRLTPKDLSVGLSDGSMDWREPALLDHLRLSVLERLLIDQPTYHGLAEAQARWCSA